MVKNIHVAVKENEKAKNQGEEAAKSGLHKV